MVLAYDRKGSGEPLLLIHGISHRRQAWQPVFDQLAASFDVIAVDLPGHGESPAFELGDRTVREALTGELGDLLDALGVERPHVVGNSLGALLAIELAEAGLARSVTAFAPAGFWYGPIDFGYVYALFAGIQAAARRLEPVAPKVLRSRAGRTLAFGWAVAHPGRIDPEAAIGDLRNMVASRAAIRTMFTGAYVYVYGGCPVPMTIAWGTRDTVLLPYHALRARRVLPNAVHRWLPGCGHIPMSDDPGLVVDTILEGARAAQQTTTQQA